MSQKKVISVDYSYIFEKHELQTSQVNLAACSNSPYSVAQIGLVLENSEDKKPCILPHCIFLLKASLTQEV